VLADPNLRGALLAETCAALPSIARRAESRAEFLGGSTYGFAVWDDHPHRAEVLGFLRATRERAVALRQKIAAFNAAHPVGDHPMKVIAYVGQTILGYEEGNDE
jgi:hypothetical protein